MVQVLCKCGLWWTYDPGKINYCMFCGTPGKELIDGEISSTGVGIGGGKTLELESVVLGQALGYPESGGRPGSSTCFT